MIEPSKMYLGDSVYADFQDGMIVLTTENGLPGDPSNIIYMEESVWLAFSKYIERLESKS